VRCSCTSASRPEVRNRWIPAFAGMTAGGRSRRVPCPPSWRKPDHWLLLCSSSPRKRGSRDFSRSLNLARPRRLSPLLVIPAKAGIHLLVLLLVIPRRRGSRDVSRFHGRSSVAMRFAVARHPSESWDPSCCCLCPSSPRSRGAREPVTCAWPTSRLAIDTSRTAQRNGYPQPV
jgi:hypothetical protein